MRRWAALLAVAAGMLVVRPAAAEATAPLACGSHITRSVTLRYDLHCSGQSGLTVDRSHVTVDLHGHTITGDIITAGSYGVGVMTTVKDVTIKNGTIRRFEGGIAGFGRGTRVLNVVSIGAGAIGIEVHDRGIVSDSFASDALGFGIFARGAGALLRGNLVTRNTDGLAVNGPSRAIGNRAIKNNDAGIAVGGGGAKAEKNMTADNAAAGIEVFGSSPNVEPNTVSGNHVLDNHQYGIHVTSAPVNNLISHNDVRANGSGIVIDTFAVGNRIEDNSVLDNTNSGILTSAKTVISKDSITGNGVNGIELDTGADKSVVSGNIASANGNSGIVSNADAEIVGNVANENVASGIVLSVNGTVDRNTANFNGFLNGTPGNALGISDLAGTPSTLHRNVASGNANTSGQCDPSALCTSPSVHQTVTFLHCGDSVAANTILGNNLSCPSGDGLEITKSVTLDLHSHRIDTPTANDPSYGVDVQADRAVVRNGEISGFGWAVAADHQATVSGTVESGGGDLTGPAGNVSGNVIVGGNVQVNGEHGVVHGNVILDPGDVAMWLQQAVGHHVANNLVWGCSGAGIDLEGAGSSGRANSISGNTVGDCHIGITLVAVTAPTVVRANRAYSNDAYGFIDDGSAASDVTRNGFWDNGTAIGAFASGDRITKNRMFASSSGIVLSATNASVAHNSISGSGDTGFVLNDAATGDSIVANVISSGAAAGLVEGHGGNTIRSNHLIENAHDGIYVQTSSGSLVRNVAIANGWVDGIPSGSSDFGIEVATGVTPPRARHNRARGNASGTPQCSPPTVC